MVGVRPTTLVGHPRTNHQSVMEHGGVRPAHLVGHPSLRSRQGNPGSEYQAGVVRGRHSITAMASVEPNSELCGQPAGSLDLEEMHRMRPLRIEAELEFAVEPIGGKFRLYTSSNQPPKCYGTWLVSDQLP